MPDFKTENLNWLDNLAALEAQLQKTPSWTNDQLAKALNLSPSLIGYLRALKTCFDPAAIEKVRLAAKADPPFVLSYNSAKALAGLVPRPRGSKGKEIKPDLTAFHTVLDTTLSRRLKTNQIETLVESLVKVDSPEKELAQGLPTLPEDLKKFLELAEKVKTEIARNAASPDGDKQTTYQDELRTLLKKGTAESEENEDSGKKGKAGKKSKSASQNDPSLFWEWMLGVKFMSQLKSKAKKGELTTNEKNLVLADKFLVKPLGWVFGNLGKLLKKMGIGLWHSVEEAAGKTVKKILAVVLPLLFIVLILWAVLAFFHFAVISPLHWMENKIGSVFHHTDTAPEPTPIPASVSAPPPVAPQTSLSKGLGQPSPVTPHVASQQMYQPAVSFSTTASALNPSSTLYDPKILESEIKSLPANCLVKDYPMTPDEGMPGDVAVSRMRDLIDPDKYTMLISGGKQTIKLVSPTNTTLTIDYKSTDIFNVLGDDKSPMNFLWEDVKYIHANEIDIETKNPSVNANGNNNGPLAQPNLAPQFVTSAQMYQCSLVVSGSKYPLTIQCAAAADLEHLVSTMQYFIRSSRLAHDTALGGMPYLHQGLMFNNQCVVEKLWADSPADKAGVKLRDMVWSVEQNTGLPPDRKTLETQLGFLASGPHNLFIVSPADRDKAQVEMNANHSNVFNPKRGKVVLSAP